METESIYTERIAKIKPLLNKYWELLEKIDAPKGSALDKAVNYSLNNKMSWKASLQMDGWS